MNKNTSVNMGNESSAHNNINDIVLKKKTLNAYDEVIDNAQQYNNNQHINTNYQNGSLNNQSTIIKKEEFIQTNPNYQSGILEKREIKENRKPSILIIFIILVAVFFGEVIYHTIFDKNSNDETNIKENNNQNEDSNSELDNSFINE